MKKSKKIVSLLLSVLMIITALPLTAVNSFAEDTNTKTSGDYEYTVSEDGTAEITKYTGSATELAIPSEFDGYEVKSIGASAFWYCTALTRITIPDNVTNIGASAFCGCKSLTEITIPDSVTNIGGAAFSRCDSLASITVPDSVLNIGSGAFYSTAYYRDSSNWDNGILYIGNHLLEAEKDISGSVEIKQGTKTIAEGAFWYRTSLTSITIPNGVISIGPSAFASCSSLTSVTIPDSVVSIGFIAFFGCTALTEITIPDSVTSIGTNAFIYCTSLAEINVGSESINYSSENGVLFNKNKSLLICYPIGKTDLSYSIPSTVTSIGNYAFYNCTSLTSVSIPDSVTDIGEYAFMGCSSLINATIPNSVTSIGNYAFSDCTSLTSVSIPDSVTYIGECAFQECSSLTSVTIPDSVTSICDSTFYYCTSLKSITIGKGVTSIGNGAFFNCIMLKSVIIPDSVTNIDDGAFAHTSLANITIPDNVTYVSSNAFEECLSLTEINVGSENTNYSSENGVLFNKEKTVLIKYPAGKTEAEYVIPESVTSVGNEAFRNCASISKVTIPNSVKYIGWGAFYNCNALECVTIPESVETINDCAFGDSDYGKKDDFTIIGKIGSAAELYAMASEFNFVSTGIFISFPDVPANEWYYTSVLFNAIKGYFHGYENGYFGPADNIQRQDFVVVLSKIAGADLSAYAGQNGGFADVPTDGYYSAAVAWAKDNHLLSGYANGKFGVGDPITREQACLIFYNYCNGAVSGEIDAVLAGYPDGGNVSDWARTAVAWAAENHVVGGNGTLNPVGNANRAEMAQIIMNMSDRDIL